MSTNELVEELLNSNLSIKTKIFVLEKFLGASVRILPAMAGPKGWYRPSTLQVQVWR